MSAPQSPPEPVHANLGGDPILAAFHAAFAEAELHFRHGDAPTALSKYNAALDVRPGDRAVLLARSRCLLSLGLPAQALKDADALLAVEKENPRAILLRAEALYASGDFENALVWFHRGARIKPELDEFRLGIQKAQESVMNGIGIDPDPAPKVEVAALPAAAAGAAKRHRRNTVLEGALRQAALKASLANGSDIDAAKKPKPSARAVGGPKSPSQPSKPSKTVALASQPPLDPPNGQLHRDHIYLGPLSVDKAYLQDLLADPSFVHNPNEEVMELARKGVKFLEERCEFWRRRLGSSAETRGPTPIAVRGTRKLSKTGKA
ncbi:Tetratricopeptide repeat protein 25 [Gonapodya sp. JEL0774]|nr:Tetratricopeptide repeat protein 25 [Gonapodya sp. JEL0774]